MHTSHIRWLLLNKIFFWNISHRLWKSELRENEQWQEFVQLHLLPALMHANTNVAYRCLAHGQPYTTFFMIKWEHSILGGIPVWADERRATLPRTLWVMALRVGGQAKGIWSSTRSDHATQVCIDWMTDKFWSCHDCYAVSSRIDLVGTDAQST